MQQTVNGIMYVSTFIIHNSGMDDYKKNLALKNCSNLFSFPRGWVFISFQLSYVANNKPLQGLHLHTRKHDCL